MTEHRKARQQRRQTNGSLQTGGLIPVILSTDKLIFNREQGVNEKTLTLYNPFEFEIDYKCKNLINLFYTSTSALRLLALHE